MNSNDSDEGSNNIPSTKTQKFYFILAIVLIFSFIVIPIFWFLCLESVGPTEYGIAVNIMTGDTDYRILEAGLHFVPVSRVIRFPKILQTVEFVNVGETPSMDGIGRLEARTKDGLDVSFRLSFQYKLQKEHIVDLYKNFGEDYELTFIEIARGEIRDIASLYTAIEFFNDTSKISNDFHSEFGAILSEKGFADVPFFQLKGVSLPIEFENAINRAEVALRNIEIAQLQQQEAMIRAETTIIEAQANASITILQAEANAEAFLINIVAQAEGVNITLTQQSISYYALAQTLGLNSTELLSYLWIMAVMEHDSSYLIIGDFTPFLPITNP